MAKTSRQDKPTTDVPTATGRRRQHHRGLLQVDCTGTDGISTSFSTKCTSPFCVNLAQARIIREEGANSSKRFGCRHFLVGVPNPMTLPGHPALLSAALLPVCLLIPLLDFSFQSWYLCVCGVCVWGRGGPCHLNGMHTRREK